jgi:hypothetical protein
MLGSKADSGNFPDNKELIQWWDVIYEQKTHTPTPTHFSGFSFLQVAMGKSIKHEKYTNKSGQNIKRGAHSQESIHNHVARLAPVTQHRHMSLHQGHMGLLAQPSTELNT